MKSTLKNNYLKRKTDTSLIELELVKKRRTSAPHNNFTTARQLLVSISGTALLLSSSSRLMFLLIKQRPLCKRKKITKGWNSHKHAFSPFSVQTLSTLTWCCWRIFSMQEISRFLQFHADNWIQSEEQRAYLIMAIRWSNDKEFSSNNDNTPLYTEYPLSTRWSFAISVRQKEN